VSVGFIKNNVAAKFSKAEVKVWHWEYSLYCLRTSQCW